MVVRWLWGFSAITNGSTVIVSVTIFTVTSDMNAMLQDLEPGGPHLALKRLRYSKYDADGQE